MIEKIQSDECQLNINQGPPPDPGEYETNNQQDIAPNLLNKSAPYFNNLFSAPQTKEEKEEDKSQDIKRNPLQKSKENEIIEENDNQNIFPSKDFSVNNIQFHNDIEKLPEDNIDNNIDTEFDYDKFENLTIIKHKNSNITENLNFCNNININNNINKGFLQNKNLFTEISKNKKYLLNGNSNIKINSKHEIISKKWLREKDKIKCKKKYRKNIIKKYYIVHFIRFLKKYGNILIKKIILPTKFHKDKLYIPTKSLILLLINEDNSNILLFTIKDIFCYKQIKNEKIINNLWDYINKHPYKDKDNYDKIISFFNMNIQDACELFEESKEFNQYMNNQKIIMHNKDFKLKFGFCLIEKNGFIKMIKNNGNIDYTTK